MNEGGLGPASDRCNMTGNAGLGPAGEGHGGVGHGLQDPPALVDAMVRWMAAVRFLMAARVLPSA